MLLPKIPFLQRKNNNHEFSLLHYILLLTLAGTILIGIFAIFSNWHNTLKSASVTLIIIIFLLVLLYYKHEKLSAHLFVIYLLTTLTISIYSGDGLNDPGIIVFPVIILIASQIMDFRYYFLYTAITILSLLFVAYLQLTGSINIIINKGAVILSFILLTIVLIVIALFTRYLFSSLVLTIKKLKTSEEKYRYIFENIQDVYFELNFEGEIIEISPSIDINTQYTVQEVLHTHINNYFLEPSNAKEFINSTRHAGRVRNYEQVLLDKNGAHLNIIISARVLDSKDKQGPKIVGSIRNITDKKKMEQQLMQMQKLESISSMSGSIANEFEKLLNIINDKCGLLATGRYNDPQALENIKKIQVVGEKASVLTRQLLTFSKNQAFKPSSMNLNQCVLEMQSILNTIIDKNINLEIDLSTDLPLINADPGQIEQIIVNLVKNSNEALQTKQQTDSKTIFIQTGMKELDTTFIQGRSSKNIQAGDYILLSVSDNGIGMDRDVQNNIFEPFFSLKSNHNGLGLSTVYGIIQQNNGIINIYSEPGHGTTIHIYWPVDYEKQTIEHPEQTVLQHGSETIVLVEDDIEFLNFTIEVLKSVGYRVFGFSNGYKALEFIQTHNGKVNLVITDLVMPEIDGKEFISKLHTLHPHIPVILTSGFTKELVTSSMEQENQFFFLQKPFTVTELAEFVRKTINR